MWKNVVEDVIGPAAGYFGAARLESIPWRRIAVDAGLLAAFVLTSSWFVRG